MWYTYRSMKSVGYNNSHVELFLSSTQTGVGQVDESCLATRTTSKLAYCLFTCLSSRCLRLCGLIFFGHRQSFCRHPLVARIANTRATCPLIGQRGSIHSNSSGTRATGLELRNSLTKTVFWALPDNCKDLKPTVSCRKPAGDDNGGTD